MKKFTFEIYETWKIEKSFEAETLEDAWELASEHANYFDLQPNEDGSKFVENEVHLLSGEDS